MSKSAPSTRIVDALTGNMAGTPSQFFKALSEADSFIAELDGLHELRTRNAELEGALKIANADADDAAETIGHLIRERDNLASDLADLREAHMHTVTALAQARGERDTFRARIERSGW